MTGRPPVATDEQLAARRDSALRARQYRAKVKVALRDGRVTLASVLDAGGNGVGDPLLGRMKVHETLCAVRGWGPKKVGDLLSALEVAPDLRLDKLPERKRQRIIAAMQPAE